MEVTALLASMILVTAIDLPLYFVGVPAGASAVAVAWCRRAMRAVAAEKAGFLQKPEVAGRFLVFATHFVIPIVFGILLLVLALPFSEDAPSGPALRSVGVMFATASALAIVSEAWIIVRHASVAFDTAFFGRVLTLQVIPITVAVFSLVVAMEAFARLPGSFDATGATLPMIAGSFSAPLMAWLANREETLDDRGFGRAIFAAALGDVPLVVALVVAIRAIGPV